MWNSDLDFLVVILLFGLIFTLVAFMILIVIVSWRMLKHVEAGYTLSEALERAIGELG